MTTHKDTAIYLTFATALLLASTQVQAANGNTAYGTGALPGSTGAANSAFGESSLGSNTTGYENTASGYRSLYSNTTGLNNTASGSRSLYFTTTGDYNTATLAIRLLASMRIDQERFADARPLVQWIQDAARTNGLPQP